MYAYVYKLNQRSKYIVYTCDTILRERKKNYIFKYLNKNIYCRLQNKLDWLAGVSAHFLSIIC